MVGWYAGFDPPHGSTGARRFAKVLDLNVLYGELEDPGEAVKFLCVFLAAAKGALSQWRLAAAEVPLLGVIEAELQSLDGMPHLGKAHKLPAGYIGEGFPALGEFCAVARRVDPKWAFSSDWFGNLGGSDD